MTKTLTGYMMLWFISRCLNKDILMSYLHSKRHYWAKVTWWQLS